MDIRPGQKVRFSAATPNWGLSDWYGYERVRASRLDGLVGTVTCVEVSDRGDQALYVDVEFEGEEEALYAVSVDHLALVEE